MTGTEPDEKRIQEAQKILKRSIKMLDDYFLKDTKFISGSEVTIADLQAVCEITQFWLADIDLLSDKPKLNQWLKTVQLQLNPAFDKAHKLVNIAKSKGVFQNML